MRCNFFPLTLSVLFSFFCDSHPGPGRTCGSEGSTFQAKTRVIKFLHEKMGGTSSGGSVLPLLPPGITGPKAEERSRYFQELKNMNYVDGQILTVASKPGGSIEGMLSAAGDNYAFVIDRTPQE